MTTTPLVLFWQLTVAVSIVLAFYLYVPTWRALRRAADVHGLAPDARPFPVPTRRQLLLLLLALAFLALATLSPLHAAAVTLFPLRVTQHLLLIAVVPALFWAANPLPVMKRGLPRAWQVRLGDPLSAERLPARWMAALTQRGVVWFLFVAAAWLWYDPTLHALALTRPVVHIVELTTLFATALLYWWQITGAAPVLQPPLPLVMQILYAAAGALPIKILGAGAIFGTELRYVYPAESLARWGITPLQNQTWGGAIIWMVGGLAFTTAAGVLLNRWLAREEEKPVLTLEDYAQRGDLRAPGLEEDPSRR
jgi:putative membrane protein